MPKSPEPDTSPIERLRRAVSAATDLPKIQFAMESYAPSVRIKMLSYSHYPPVGAVDFGPDIRVYNFGWPASWVETYWKSDYIHIDPVPRIAARRTLPFWWSEVDKMATLDTEERAYIENIRAQRFGPGLAIPVFGPNGRNGYYAAGIGNDVPLLDEREIAELHAACQLAHLRCCDIILEALPEQVSLSERARQILAFVVRGHSNQMIAAQLSISSNTVDTYVRRCFEKLDVHDRVTAGLRGLALGLVA